MIIDNCNTNIQMPKLFGLISACLVTKLFYIVWYLFFQGNSPLHLAARKGDLNCVKAITEPVNPKHREAMVLTYDKKISYENPNLDQWNYVGK